MPHSAYSYNIPADLSLLINDRIVQEAYILLMPDCMANSLLEHSTYCTEKQPGQINAASPNLFEM